MTLRGTVKLRARLGITLLLLVTPLAVGFAFAQVWWQERLFHEGVTHAMVGRMEAGGRDACEASPEGWPEVRRPRRGRRRGVHRGKGQGRGEARGARRRRQRHQRPGVLFAYDAAYLSENPAAPPFDAELRAQLEAGEAIASRIVGRGPAPHAYLETAVQMPWTDGPCAILVSRRPGPPHAQDRLMKSLLPSLLVTLLAALVAALAAGPIVRRIRQLTVAVRRAAAGGGEAIEVDGDDEIGELANAFEANRVAIAEQLARLEAREQALTRYLANTTHDVMLPLTVLQGHLIALRKLAEANEGGAQDRGQSEVVGAALQEAHYMASLLHNLNAAARLEADVEVEPHPVDLNALVERIIARHGPIAEERGVALDYAVPEAPVVLEGDVTLLEQAVGNVVHNAVRYNERGGHVAVLLEVVAERLTLRVLDDGPGVPKEQLERLLERRFRGDAARSRYPGGLGLGLSIAREAAARHGLCLRLEARPEGGLVATFEGPLVS